MLPHYLPHYPAPAKLNLDLRIISKRPDGYHELESIFTLIDLQDTLCIAPRDDNQIILHTPTKGVLAQYDLTVRAAQVLQAYSPHAKGADIWIEKHIPMGAGLGGGSSNAATVLMVLNQLWHCHLSTDTLIRLGQTLGADIPFFIFGQTAFARGIGEQLTIFNVPKQYYIVVHPNISIPTAKIFAHTDLPRHSPSQANPTWDNLQPLRNDMQAVVLQDYPQVKAAFDALTPFGVPRMTGSGSCVFLPCDSLQQAQSIQTKIPQTYPSWCVSSLPYHPLLSIISNR